MIFQELSPPNVLIGGPVITSPGFPHDEESEAIYPTTRLGKVSLETTNGQKYFAKVFHLRGSPENPLTRQELEEKFLGLGSIVLSGDQVKELLHGVQNLEQMKDISELAELTVSG